MQDIRHAIYNLNDGIEVEAIVIDRTTGELVLTIIDCDDGNDLPREMRIRY